MYPFMVLGVEHNVTDVEVEKRYRELVGRFPPDRAPEAFAAIRQAYEQLKTERARVHTRLFYYDQTGRSLTDELPQWFTQRPRKRLSHLELAELITQEIIDVG